MSDHPAGRKIYIVDDETLIAFTLEEILKNAASTQNHSQNHSKH